MTNKEKTIMKVEQGLISAGELADLAGVSLQSVLNYVKRGDLIPVNEDASGRMFFRKDQIVTVSFLKKGRSSMCNNILCLCFSDNPEELKSFEEKAVGFFEKYQLTTEEKSLCNVVDLFKECSKRTSNNSVVGIQRIDDFESAYNSHREANEYAVINSSDFQNEIDKMIEKEIITRVSNYESKLQRNISRCRHNGISTSFQETNLSKDLEAKKRELMQLSETPEFKELFVQRKGNALLNKYLWNSFEKDYLYDGYYSLRKIVVPDKRNDFTDILTLILRGEYKKVFIMGYGSAPEVVKQVLQVLESLHRISVEKRFNQ